MKNKKMNTVAVLLGGALMLGATANADTVLDFTFDDTANDTGPAFQEFSNGVGTGSSTLSNGVITAVSTAARGFNTVSSLDLSSYSSFTVTIVVDSAATSTNNYVSNGGFLGITAGPNANNLDGSALYNNSGSPGNPAIGIQLGHNRGSANIDRAFDVLSGNGNFLDISPAPTQASMDDGFTLFMTFTDNGGGNDAGLAITSSGLSTEIAYSGTVPTAYSNFAYRVTGNVSAQGGPIDVASYTIDAIPEPATLGLMAVFGGAIAFIRRRRLF